MGWSCFLNSHKHICVEEAVKNIFVQGIGNISITRRRSCRRLVIRVDNNRQVKVSIPFRASFAEGERFVFDKIDWIKQTSLKIKEGQTAKPLIDENTKFETRSRKLYLKRIPGQKFTLRLIGQYIEISVPIALNLSDNQVQSSIKKLIQHAIRFEAAEYLPLRVGELAKIHQFTHAGVKVKNARTRWGSCSYRNNINLNIYLVCLPDELSDYIILHELAHTVHKNHGVKFWQLLDNISGDAKKKAQLLKKHKLSEIL